MNKTTIEIAYNGVIALTTKIDLPYCSKNNCFAYKIIDEKTMLSVQFGIEDFLKAEYQGAGSFQLALKDDCTKIDEDEFDVILMSTINNFAERIKK